MPCLLEPSNGGCSRRNRGPGYGGPSGELLQRRCLTCCFYVLFFEGIGGGGGAKLVRYSLNSGPPIPPAIWTSQMSNEISPDSVRIDTNNPNWTIPRTYGVWRLSGKYRGQEFRFGNYPVRGKELVREYGAAKLLALYKTREEAEEHTRRLNGG